MRYTTTFTQTEPMVITIGNFDGIHKGHQELMHEVCRLASSLNSTPVLVTFQPHVLKVLRPEMDVRCLTTLDEKLELTRVYGGIANSIVIDFTPAVAAMSASEFMDELRAHFNLRGLVVGADFNFGHNCTGNVAFLQNYGQEHGITVQPIQLEEIQSQRVSSTRIRKLVGEGNVTEARELLGHTVMLNGYVAQGDQRGRLLGFPTANLIPPTDQLIPADGVYAARVLVRKKSPDSDAVHSPCVSLNATIHANQVAEDWDSYYGAVNIGVRPTFDGQRRLVEAHLLDVEGLDLYNQCMSIHFVARLRSEQRFAGLDALKAQIADDVRNARLILQKDEHA